MGAYKQLMGPDWFNGCCSLLGSLWGLEGAVACYKGQGYIADTYCNTLLAMTHWLLMKAGETCPRLVQDCINPCMLWSYVYTGVVLIRCRSVGSRADVTSLPMRISALQI